MKILAVRGKNLASLEGEFEIDFTSEPLRSAGIYAITGQTGAGKSTILDALCLALYDDAPRLNKAESIKKEDLESLEDKISPQDCRNILRRGAGEGYAEVEFFALTGEKYRSRWMVRRARGKSDGALQPTSMVLENLSTQTQEQGTKKDLLAKITEIIGLTFDQFTRAVLLAQGDFATFLKARQNEKAELLEKLTGTEMYSKISIFIYQRTTEARNSLDMVRQRIKDIKLLSDEESDSLTCEKQDIEKEAEPLKNQTVLIEKKLEWISREKQLKNEILKAENELKEASENIIRATPRYEYMSLIDTTQEIRDAYFNLIRKQKQQEQQLSGIYEKEKELESLTDKSGKIHAALQSAKTEMEETGRKFKELKPEIEEAKELDFKIKSLKEKRSAATKELEAYQKQWNTSESTIAAIQQQKEEIEHQKTRLSEWFAKYDKYKHIVPKTELLISLIRDAYSTRKQKATALAGLEAGKKMLNTYVDQLIQYEKEAERLNNLLPTEVLNLRLKLQDEMPCPVCGSIHHPFRKQTEQEARINETKLESQKKNIAETIILIKENIEKTNKSLTEFETLSTGFDNRYTETCNELGKHLPVIPDWEGKFSKETLEKELADFASRWNTNRQQLDLSNQQSENYSIRLETEIKARNPVKAGLKEKEELKRNLETAWDELITRRKELLGNKSAEEVETYFSSIEKQQTKQYESLRTEKEKKEKEKAAIEGTINQLKKDKEQNKEEITLLRTTIRDWLKKESRITPDLLKDLMSKSGEWINRERNELNELKNRELIRKTTLTERKGNLQNHGESEYKPSTEESNDSLSGQLTAVAEKAESLNKRLTEINVLLLTHHNGKKQIKAFEKELNEKTELYDNWAKLNDLLGSASGNKFKTIAQGYTLDVLLSYANKHLEELTRRYKLEKIPNTLALQVIDNDMLDQVRTVHSLSGGESFLISLALALGLSSLSSNRMKIESLFIDEGFGALDMDTLNIAMDALDNLQTQGRKIGVISHVEEMKERITTQIQVIKSSNGRSYVKITG